MLFANGVGGEGRELEGWFLPSSSRRFTGVSDPWLADVPISLACKDVRRACGDACGGICRRCAAIDMSRSVSDWSDSLVKNSFIVDTSLEIRLKLFACIIFMVNGSTGVCSISCAVNGTIASYCSWDMKGNPGA